MSSQSGECQGHKRLTFTTAFAASAVAKALPALEGKLTGSAIRVPTPNVSLAIMNLELTDKPGRDHINQYLRQVATKGALGAQIGWTSMPDTVSSDLVGAGVEPKRRRTHTVSMEGVG